MVKVSACLEKLNLLNKQHSPRSIRNKEVDLGFGSLTGDIQFMPPCLNEILYIRMSGEENA